MMRDSLSPVSNVSKEEVTGISDCSFSGNLRAVSMIFSRTQENLVSLGSGWRALYVESSLDGTSIVSAIYHIFDDCTS
jgi:hypothetical protein